MSEFLVYVQLGFRHITDLAAADHILFLLALAAIYRFRDWRSLLWVVSAFTVGHSVTLALAVTKLMALPMPLIEFLIPVTIVITAAENLLVRERAGVVGRRRRYRPVLAGVFGLVHGAGFANYLQSLFVERVAVPLLGFNVGIEVGQIVVLMAAAGCFWAVDRVAATIRPRESAPWLTPFRMRAMAVSSIVLVVSMRWAAERAPW